MQTAMIPQITCKTIHRMNHNFLWGDTRNHSRCHTIGWDMITRPKEEGKRFKHLKKKKKTRYEYCYAYHQAWRR